MARSLADLDFEVEQMGAREAAAEDLMLGLRMSAGIGAPALDRARQVIPAPALDGALAWAVDTGLATWQGEGDARRLAPTERGWLMGNELYGRFWDLASD